MHVCDIDEYFGVVMLSHEITRGINIMWFSNCRPHDYKIDNSWYFLNIADVTL